MKKTNWLILAALTLAAMGLRVGQNRTGFDEAGLAVSGNLPALLLPVVLLAAALALILFARALPAGRSAGLRESFPFRNQAAVLCAVAGVFLLFAGAALSALGGGTLLTLLLAAFCAAGAACTLYTVFGLYRGGEVQGMALLVPVCALAVRLVFLYRTDAADPVLARIYIEILAVAALTLSALERAAFAFRSGSPRVYLPVSGLAVLLALTAAVEQRSLAGLALFAGGALVELGFLAAAERGTAAP